MIIFCMKSLHSFLGFANSKDIHPPAGRPFLDIPYPAGGLGFIANPITNSYRPANVVESATIKSSSPPPPPPSLPPPPPISADASKRAPGGIGFLDEVGGSVDGMTSVTESLGCESSDERRTDVEIGVTSGADFISRPTNSTAWKNSTREKKKKKKKNKKFPPPITSLNHEGKPNFFLRPVRKDGRLQITEVRIGRPEILRASRQDGRLRLHLVRNDVVQEEEEDHTDDTIDEEEKTQAQDKIEKRETGQWFTATCGGGGDGFRRCYEMVGHQDLHVWSQRCVTIR